jgi:hypothetical protein
MWSCTRLVDPTSFSFLQETSYWLWLETGLLGLTTRCQVKHEVPILSQKTVPARSLDLTRMCGQYFSLKLQRLSDGLALTDAQVTNIRPILEQEAAEVDEICFNLVLSQQEQLNQFQRSCAHQTRR